jgi:UDP-N-acetylglucosamine 4,6-dehydratase/5-epimerase
MLNNKSILVTGGTGSFGKHFIQTVLERFPGVERIVIYSRDELKQYELASLFPTSRYKMLRYFLGDVRDLPRLRRALERINIVIHAAALKQVPAAEYNPFECIKTNIIGAQNLIEACMDSKVSKVIALSSDKAAAPINLYGATKLCSDKLFVAANQYKGGRDIRFSVVRYGNVFCSRGSVVPLFYKHKQRGEPLPVTDPGMTRFTITIDQSVDFVIKCLETMQSGEIFVPKIPSYRILDIAEAIAPGEPYNIIGIRPGEKLHEEMITRNDAFNAIEFADYYVILPTVSLWDEKNFAKKNNGKLCKRGFHYSSEVNEQWLSVEELRELIEKNQSMFL